MTIDSNPDHLHPKMAGKVKALMADLAHSNLTFDLFETYRSPERQAQVIRAGTSRALPWTSPHQFGMAADFAWMSATGHWDWSADHDWHILVAPISWDLGHLELPHWKE